MKDVNGLDSGSLNAKKLLFIGGKGGVGKTTIASTIAYHLSRQHKTVLISTDPAHSTSHSWQCKNAPLPTKLPLKQHDLSIWELDAHEAFQVFKDQHRHEIRQWFGTSTQLDEEDVEQLVSHLLPGLDEVMGFKSIVDVIKDDVYTKVVVDTAPTGHALRLLLMPQILDAWIKTLASMRWKYRYVQKTFTGKVEPDQADDLLLALKRSVAQMKALLQDGSQSEFILVAAPTMMAIMETQSLHKNLSENDVTVQHLIVNKVAPASTDLFYQQLYKEQQQKVALIHSHFSQLSITQMPLFSQEVHGEERIELFEQNLFKIEPE